MIESNLDPWPVQALEATLGLTARRASAPEELPPLWHWLYFLPTAPRSSIGPDGYVVDEEWVDSTLRRRRLFAAARTDFLRPLHVGLRAQMTERVLGRRDKQGKSGPFQIVTAEYQYFQNGALCVREERDIVYLEGPVRAQPASKNSFATNTEESDTWTLTLTPDPVLLMRFSALTFNSHLIHFDQLYTQREEGYPERVVHGPLVAIVLAQLLALNGVDRLRRFEFRARSPVYVNHSIQLMGKPESDRVDLRAIGDSGMLAMEATAWLAGSAA
ncbi:MAG: acyl-CoA dehydrogenase [Pseudomonadota bacterium]|nr:acyl-CoA dehydrogenase [Pseudomonadota bacterium]